MINNFNDFLGLPYNSKAIFKNEKGETNCSGFVSELDEDYKQLTEAFISPVFFRKLKEKVLELYEEISFENREPLDIIFFKNKEDRNFSHVGVLVDKDNFIHNEESKFGSKIENIQKMLFFNKDIKIYRDKRGL